MEKNAKCESVQREKFFVLGGYRIYSITEVLYTFNYCVPLCYQLHGGYEREGWMFWFIQDIINISADGVQGGGGGRRSFSITHLDLKISEPAGAN